MIIEITDRADFKTKLAHLIDAKDKLTSAGLDPDDKPVTDLTDAFLDQFAATTMARVAENTLGYIVVCNMTGWVPADFAGQYFETYEIAIKALENWIKSTRYGKVSTYGVRKVSYFA